MIVTHQRKGKHPTSRVFSWVVLLAIWRWLDLPSLRTLVIYAVHYLCCCYLQRLWQWLLVSVKGFVSWLSFIQPVKSTICYCDSAWAFAMMVRFKRLLRKHFKTCVAPVQIIRVPTKNHVWCQLIAHYGQNHCLVRRKSFKFEKEIWTVRSSRYSLLQQKTIVNCVLSPSSWESFDLSKQATLSYVWISIN